MSAKHQQDGPDQPGRAEGHDREVADDQHLDDGDKRSPVDVDDLLRNRRSPVAGLIDIDGSIVAIMASCRRPVPLFCAFHSASIAWN
jgi:hypothetical protein